MKYKVKMPTPEIHAVKKFKKIYPPAKKMARVKKNNSETAQKK